MQRRKTGKRPFQDRGADLHFSPSILIIPGGPLPAGWSLLCLEVLSLLTSKHRPFSPLCFFAVVGVVDVMHGSPERTINESVCAIQTKCGRLQFAYTGGRLLSEWRGELCTNAFNCPSSRLSIHTTAVVSICRGVDFLLGTKGKSQYSLSDAPSSSREFPRDVSFHHFCFIYKWVMEPLWTHHEAHR